MSIWKQVTALENGQNVDADVLNRPLSELAERTNYLKGILDSFGLDDTKSSVRIPVKLKEPEKAWVGAIVCIDPETKEYVLASASMSLFDAYRNAFTCFAIGMLVSVDVGAGTGVAVVFGLADISGSEFVMSRMLETGEEFQNGMKYLSSVEPGRITSEPEGPRVQVGVFTMNAQTNSLSYGDYAFISPQYGDVMSHIHRTYRMSAKPAGSQRVVGRTASRNGKAKVDGYAADFYRSGGQELDGEAVPRLRVGGGWFVDENTSYEIWLSGSSDAEQSKAVMPSQDFSNVFLWWRSSNDTEGSGCLKVAAFFEPVSVGKSGLVVSIEPGTTSFGTVYSVSEDIVDKRTWTIEMPKYGRGWAPNYSDGEADLGGSIVRVHGKSARGSSETYVSVPENVFDLGSENPSVGQRLVVTGHDGSDTVFQFIDADYDESELDSGVIAVSISGSAFDTFANAACVYGDKGRKFSIAFDPSDRRVYVCARGASLAGTALDSVSNNGKVNVFVTNQDGECLATGGFASFSSSAETFELRNGMLLYFKGPSGGTVNVDDGAYGIIDTETGCPGAAYRYNIEMDQALSASFPPVPAKSGSLMLNGVELESDEFFGNQATFGIGADSIYWYDDDETRTPWPALFSDVETDMALADTFRLLFHFISSFHCDTGPVTSLRPTIGSPIKVYRCGTVDPATVGDLEIDVDITTDVFDSNVQGYKAVKTGRNGRLLLGPVVERIVAGPGIEIDQRQGQPSGQGIVTISATNASYSGEVDTVALENAKEEMIGMFPYIRLLGWSSDGTNIKTGFVVKFQVPRNVAQGVYRIRLYATVFGEDSFSGEANKRLAGLRMTYNILPNWSLDGTDNHRSSMNLKSDIIAPDAERVVDIPFGVGSDNMFSYKAFDPILIHNDSSISDMDGRSAMAIGSSFPDESECSTYALTHVIGGSALGVRPGYIVAVRIYRESPSDTVNEYTGRIGFTDIRWSLVRVEDDDTAVVEDEVDSGTVIMRLREVAKSITTSTTNTTNDIRKALLRLADELR